MTWCENPTDHQKETPHNPPKATDAFFISILMSSTVAVGKKGRFCRLPLIIRKDSSMGSARAGTWKPCSSKDSVKEQHKRQSGQDSLMSRCRRHEGYCSFGTACSCSSQCFGQSSYILISSWHLYHENVASSRFYSNSQDRPCHKKLQQRLRCCLYRWYCLLSFAMKHTIILGP